MHKSIKHISKLFKMEQKNTNIYFLYVLIEFYYILKSMYSYLMQSNKFGGCGSTQVDQLKCPSRASDVCLPANPAS